jgi:ABC-type Fe3+/spermidine/putrescine transport system ATPase subunit
LPEVDLVGVTKTYGTIKANDRVSLRIKNGEYVSIIGPSGCGKSTLIKNIAGIITPDEGKVYINGELVNNLPMEDRGIGYVFQDIALFPHMTVWDNVVYGPKVRGVSQEETRPLAIEMLELIKLGARSDAYPSELSGGSQQKTAVARALLSRAELLLLDEPLGALDVKVRKELRYELRQLVKDLKLTALHVTHDQEEALSISDRVVVMKRGRIVEAGSPLDLFVRPQNIFTANFVGEANFLDGTITKTSHKGVLLEFGEGMHMMTENKGGGVGDRVVVAFRPEFTTIAESKSLNELAGRVVEILYSGNLIRIRVELVDGTPIVAKEAVSWERPTLKIGDAITINVSPTNILTYPYPEEGLSKELALE